MKPADVAASAAEAAPLLPGLSATTALRTRLPDGHAHRHDGSLESLERTQYDFSGQIAERGAEERVAHPVEKRRHGRKVDGDLIGEPFGTTGMGRLGPEPAGCVVR